MDFLRELIKMKEGFMPDFQSMPDQQLLTFCRELGIEGACKLDPEGRILNREEVIRDLESGALGDADIDTPMDPREDVDMSYDHVERDHDEPYEPDQVDDMDHNEDEIHDDMSDQFPTEAYTNLRKKFDYFKPVKMKKGLMQKGVKTIKENTDMEQARTMYRRREADYEQRDQQSHAVVSVPREIDLTDPSYAAKYANVLAVWNDSMQKHETLVMVWPKLVAAMQTIKESTYKKVPGTLGGKKIAKVYLKEDAIPVVKFKNPYTKLVTPAHGGLQKDVASKSAEKAIEDEIGNDGMKGMKKKDRPYMEKPRFRDWLTANMVFNMTKSGELAGNMKLSESERKYSGKHPKKIKSVAGQGRGKVSVVTNDGTKHTVLAKDTKGVMPKVGEVVSKYVNEGAGKKKISEAKLRENEEKTKQMCEWFARCKNPATGTTPHPVLGNVPTCDRCHKFATNEVRKEKLGENDPFNHQSDKLAQLKYDYQQRQKKLTAAKKNRTSREGTKLKGAAHRRTEK